MQSSGRSAPATGGSATSTPVPASRIRGAGLLLLTAHLVFVAWLALRPVSVAWVAPANLHPLATIRHELGQGAPAALDGLGGELLLLAPLGVLLPLASGRLHRALPGTWARTVFVGALVSAARMLVQSGVPGHVVDVDSVLLNTAGVALAGLLVFPVVRARLRRTSGPAPHGRDEATQGATPRAARVGIAP